MGTTRTLSADDGHTFATYVAEPPEHAPPCGAVVVVQEIFGVNAHIRAVAEAFAQEGFVALAPALFDRAERGVELGYDEAGFARGRALATALTPEQYVRDLRAVVAHARAAGAERVAVVGYCLGGSLAWRAAAALSIDAAVAYYGGNIPNLLELTPRCPVLAHFGARDAYIPLAGVDALRARHPTVEVHVYDAEHGFNCDHRVHFDAPSATLARARTLAFLHAHAGVER